MKKYDLYLAPMEEITGYVFRNVINSDFGYIDKFYTPFVTPNQNNIMKTKDGRELDSKHNENLNVAIQILTNNSNHFIDMIPFIVSLGYKEININCGCPSNTVVKKNKGSGILKDLDLLDHFLNDIFNSINSDIIISVKTRIGIDGPDDIEDIMNVYNRYPISELIIHPRYQKQFYNGKPDLDAFSYFYENAKMPICYNGDIFSLSDYLNIINRFPNLKSIMIGRGAVVSPDIFRQIFHYTKSCNVSRETIQELDAYHSDLYNMYIQEYGFHNALFKMKEFWSYFIKNELFDNITDKEIRKAKNDYEYRAAVNYIFNSAI